MPDLNSNYGRTSAANTVGASVTRAEESVLRWARDFLSPASVLLACLGILCPQPSHARKPTGAFLNIPIDARAVGLGSGFLALADGAGGLGLNPSALARLRSSELNLLYAPHLDGTTLGSLAYAHPSQMGSLALSYLALKTGSLASRDETGRKTGSFSAEDRVVGLSFARGKLALVR